MGQNGGGAEFSRFHADVSDDGVLHLSFVLLTIYSQSSKLLTAVDLHMDPFTYRKFIAEGIGVTVGSKYSLGFAQWEVPIRNRHV